MLLEHSDVHPLIHEVRAAVQQQWAPVAEEAEEEEEPAARAEEAAKEAAKPQAEEAAKEPEAGASSTSDVSTFDVSGGDAEARALALRVNPRAWSMTFDQQLVRQAHAQRTHAHTFAPFRMLG